MTRSLFLLTLSFLAIDTLNLSAKTIHVPGDSLTIQGGINGAVDGDTVMVAPGIYHEKINFLGKFIVVMSRDGPSATTIQAPDSGSVVTIINGEGPNTRLEEFTITGGATFTGAGIIIRGSSPTINGNLITENTVGFCGGEGGGIAVRDSANPLIINNTIYENQAIGICDCFCYFGAGIFIDATSNPVIGGDPESGNNIYENHADNGHQLFREGTGPEIDARYNYFGVICPPDDYQVYPLAQFDLEGCSDSLLKIGGRGCEPSIPKQVVLYQNFPNPFNPSTTIQYDIPDAIGTIPVEINIYDIRGRLVRRLVNREKEPGQYQIHWNGHDEQGRQVSSGVYLYRIKAGDFTAIKKMVIIR